MNTSVGAVIEEYAQKSSGQSQQSIEEKLGALTFLINFRLTAIANVREALGSPPTYDDYRFQLIVAGTDVDHQQKIAKTNLRTRHQRWGLTSSTQDISISTVEDELIWKLNGMPDVAMQILAHPELMPADAVFAQYATAVRENRGNSVTIEQLVELAKRLAFYTAQAHPEVGGPNQVAILKKSQQVAITQPQFAALVNPINGDFALVVDSTVQDSVSVFPISETTPPPALKPQVFIRCTRREC